MAQRQQRPGDFTGTQKAKLAKEHAEAVQEREGELSMMAEAEAQAAQNRVTDYTNGPQAPLILDDEKTLADAEAELLAAREREFGDSPLVLDDSTVGVNEAPYRTIRINSDLESVTIGAGNHYTFREGEKYKVPAHVADHLEEKGYVWH
jgi:hypothetical protein